MTFTDRAKAQIRKALPDMEALRAKARETAAFIPTEWVTMTEATEALWGTSGRGNPSCVKLIEACAALGMVEIREKDARTRMVRRAMPRVGDKVKDTRERMAYATLQKHKRVRQNSDGSLLHRGRNWS